MHSAHDHPFYDEDATRYTLHANQTGNNNLATRKTVRTATVLEVIGKAIIRIMTIKRRTSRCVSQYLNSTAGVGRSFPAERDPHLGYDLPTATENSGKDKSGEA